MTVTRVLTVLLAAAVATGTAQAQSVEEFYKGKNLTMVVGAAAGGGNDFYGRLVAKYIAKHLPGQPNAVVQNMPGAVSLIAANWLNNSAPRDGTAIVQLNRAVVTEPLFENKDAKFDALKFNWIGSPSQETSVLFSWAQAPYKTYEDLFKRPIVVGADAPGGSGSVNSALLKETLDMPMKLVFGYSGIAESLLAMERGEIEGKAGQSWGVLKASRPDWLRDKKIVVLLQMGLKNEPELKGVPLIMDLVKKPADHQLLELFFAKQTMAFPIVAPPDVPADRMAALRKAFDEAMVDPQMIAEAAKQELDVKPVKGDEIVALLKSMYASPKDVVERAKTLR
jgi:tripartite-type tricarboxylate transporter receptor subunit TctC